MPPLFANVLEISNLNHNDLGGCAFMQVNERLAAGFILQAISFVNKMDLMVVDATPHCRHQGWPDVHETSRRRNISLPELGAIKCMRENNANLFLGSDWRRPGQA